MTTPIDQILVKDGAVDFPRDYDPTKGLKAGRVAELRCFLAVKPGHAEQLKEACRFLVSNPRRGEAIDAAGVHDQSMTLFDDDTRFLFATTYETEWDPYIADAVSVGPGAYYNIFKHCEGIPDGLEDHLPPTDWFKILFNLTRVTAVTYIRAYPNATSKQIKSALRLQETFEQVLDNPDAAQALEHPALGPLLEQAAD